MEANPPLPPELRPTQPDDPQSIGRFRIVGRLGAGGMGVVFGGLDESARCVAVKTIHERYAAQSRFREIFSREVELLTRVDGVCVPRVRASDVRAATPWMATGFVPGRTLRQHVTDIGVLDGAMLRAFAAGTAEALAAIHAAGVVHRDIKPGNVILSPDGPYVVDFGIATDAEAGGDPDAASSYGTPGWVSPERYRGEPGTAATDVFAWGGLLVLAATGRAPFGEGTPDELKERVLHGDPDLDGVPDELRDLASRALAKDPEARPAAESALRDLLVAAGAEPSPEESLPSLGGQLRTLLTEVWRGIDAAGHHSATWAALGAAAGAAAAPAVTVGAAAVTAGAAAPAGSSAGSGAGAGGVLAWLTGGTGVKAAAITAGAVVATGAIATGGYFAVEEFAGPSPQERVAAAAQLVEDGEGFTAEMTVQYTPDYAAEQADADADAETVLNESREVHTLRYTNGDPEIFASETVSGNQGGTEFPVTVVNHGGDIYIYRTLQYGVTNRGVYASGEEAPRSYGPVAVADPLRSLAAAEEITEESTGDGTTELSGPLTGHVFTETIEQPEGVNSAQVSVAGQVDEEPGTGNLTLDDDDRPLLLEYETDRWEVEIDFTAVDEPVAVEEPDTRTPANTLIPEEGPESGFEPGDPYGPVLVSAPECGEFDDPEGVTWRVRADSWDVACEEADRVVEQYFALEGEDYFAVTNEIGPDVLAYIIEDDWLCTGTWVVEFNPTGCHPGGYTGGDPPYEYDETSTAISFQVPGSVFDD
ncbi:hypothetical protein F4561_000798 [Lipingzhangella halophila]|uniref:Protein kinase domain-containing protein n=1 Tax=Lipingzhangella halophila TaxID=1783352 RepID=A0A7W7RE42_9ACTN|nr:serine/threonine-protein kinase [Lipingzhangella halophila]MBB4929978.1 hypothetical protein [Lipingzhangella halophila]